MSNRPSLLARLDPRAHQLEAIDAVCAEFRTADRATVVKACGTGKTLLEPEIDARMGARFTLVLTPTLGLLSQTIQTWLRQHPVRVANALCVCSDPTVVPDDTEEIPVALSAFDCPVTTSVDVARDVIRAARRGLVVFSTYQSAAVLAQALPAGFAFNLGVFDEAHCTTGLAEKEFSLALDDVGIPIAKRLFMTATPRLVRADGDDNEAIYSMDDESVYGRVVYRLTLREAIRQGLVCDYQIILACVNRRFGVDSHWLERGKLSLDGNAGANTPELAALIALQKAMAEVGARKAITFHDRVRTAGAFAALSDAIPSAHTGEPIPGFHVNGTMSMKERDAALDAFRHAQRGIATNVNCLAEGIDVPEVDLVALMATHRNPINVAQMCGRVLRLSPETGKEIGYIFVPMYLDQAGPDPETAIAGAGFAHALDAIHAMAAIDDAVAQTLTLSRGDAGGRDNTDAIMSKIKLFAPPEIVRRLRAAIEVRVFSRNSAADLDRRWNEMFQQLKDYHREHGLKGLSRHSALGMWLEYQRTRARRGWLQADRLERLMTLGVVPHSRTDAWEAGFRAYQQYWLENGHGRVHLDYVTDSGFRLGVWVRTQRIKLSREKLNSERLARLTAIGFVESLHKSNWRRGLRELENFKAETGHVNVPSRHVTPSGFRLRQWVDNQRSRHRKKKLSPDRLACLVALRVQMEPRIDDWEKSFSVTTALVQAQGHVNFLRNLRAHKSDWQQGLRELETFKAETGNVNVPRRHVTPSGFRLWQWVQAQRSSYRKEKLSPDRLACLVALGVQMNPGDARFEMTIRVLESHVQETGDDPNLPRRFVAVDGTPLGKWLIAQRIRFGQGRLNPERVSRLQALGVRLE